MNKNSTMEIIFTQKMISTLPSLLDVICKIILSRTVIFLSFFSTLQQDSGDLWDGGLSDELVLSASSRQISFAPLPQNFQ